MDSTPPPKPAQVPATKSGFKTSTKLLWIFGLMFCGLFYANTIIVAQTRASNRAIESQSRIMANQAVLTDAIACFGSVKYWFAILDNNLREKGAELPDQSAEHGMKCDLGSFGTYLKRLEPFSAEASSIEARYAIIRDLPRAAMNAYIAGDTKAGEQAMSRAYQEISAIDKGLNAIAWKINRASAQISIEAFKQAEQFRKVPALFLILGVTGIALISVVIFFNIFKPIEGIISVMMSASHDPHNTKDYIIESGARGDEAGDVMQALNSLLLQVHEGFRRTEEAEEQSAAAARELDVIFNNVADGIVTVDPEGEIVAFNKSLCSIFGYEQQDVAGMKIGDLFPEEEAAARYMKELQAFTASGGGTLVNAGPKEMTGRRASGNAFPIELSVTGIPQDDGQFMFVNVIRDIAYRKDLERQLVQAQKMEALGSLSSGIAHEINTPTQYVRDNIKFLKEAFAAYEGFHAAAAQLKETLPAPARAALLEAEKKQDIAYFDAETPEAIAQALEGVSRISEIVGAIRGFSYPATEDFSYIDLNEAIRNTVIVTRNQWKPVADMKLELEEGLPPVSCLPGKVVQVVLNLIVNATHAIEAKTAPGKNVITLSTAATPKTVFIRVADTGIGIPEENISKIFNPFFTTKEVGKGTGQGLAISYDIVVNKHGGTLSVESEPGKGSIFCIALPIEAEGAPPHRA